MDSQFAVVAVLCRAPNFFSEQSLGFAAGTPHSTARPGIPTTNSRPTEVKLVCKGPRLAPNFVLLLEGNAFTIPYTTQARAGRNVY